MDVEDLKALIQGGGEGVEAWNGELDPAEWDLEVLLNAPVLQSLMEDYARITTTVTAILDLKGKVLVAVGWQDICTRFHRAHPECARFCVESDLFLAGNVKRGEYVAYKCRSGLWDVVTPLYVSGTHMGNIYTGQFFYDDEVIDRGFFEGQAEAYGFDKEAYLAALDRVPRFSHGQVERLMDFLVKFTDLVSRFTLGNLRAAAFIREQSRSALALRRSEAALRGSQAMLALILDTIPQSVFWKDADGRYLGCNKSFAASAGFSDPDQIIGKTDFDLPWTREETEAYRADDREVLASRRPKLRLSETLSLADGRRLQVETSKVPLLDTDGNPFAVVGIFEDVTEMKHSEEQRRKLEVELDHFQKLESLGRLAGGVAHDMNNILAAIMSVTEILRVKHADVAGLWESLELVDKASARGRDLVKTLVAFTRKEISQAVAIDVNELVRVEMGLLDRTLMKKYKLIMELGSDLPAASGDPSALASALMNLCVNAVDALSEGGHLKILTRRQGDAFVEILVEDTGAGMTSEVLNRAVEPFFTTKPKGKGTGLGLSQVFNTARAHGGYLTIESEPGKGTRATLGLPCQPGISASPAADETVRTEEALTILLVDDEDLIRSTMPMMLGFLGHRVTPVAGGREALAYLEDHEVPDLIILDMNMPGMTGLETWIEIRRRFRDIRILVATGFLEDPVASALAADPRAGAIAKPYSLHEFQSALARFPCLGSATPPD
ncbi:MAG: PAS domain-containing protein [Holophaga sp.]|nr:PAS domain-containing protein [Holophaga sp.]